jgi:hypothetical protein
MKYYFLLFFIAFRFNSFGQIEIRNQAQNPKNQFGIVDVAGATDILFDANDEVLVEKVARFLAQDIESVTGKKVEVLTNSKQAKNKVIILGTIGKSAIISKLISSKKLKVDAIRGQWERFIITTVANPLPGVKEALVVVGSDKRGLAYGTFSISEKIGVSPWHYWADAPIKKNAELYLTKTTFTSKSPSVKYRGIFLNDEAPALRNWAKQQFGDFNSKFYEKVYELLLRNKANYLWPAMWQPSVFSTDDPLNPKVANDYGIVISTTHHEPMMRYHEEWGRSKGGAWNYETNKEKLQVFWREGIERNGSNESVVALGMRGDGDEAMSKETAVNLLQNIITDQRKIIADVTKKPANQTPQVWALYKEVQDYYDKGMRAPDDVMVLFCDDNWGNVRILPKKEDLKHPGGYGMYYHFDFVGGPVSYRWINVSQIERVWEQMNLSYQWGVKDLWIVNVGDLKPMELPISLFLDQAYDAESIKAADLPLYHRSWAAQQFGEQNSSEIGELLALTAKYAARRTPEMLKPDTYSLDNYREAERVLEEYEYLYKRSNTIYEKLPPSHSDAFYQLVHYPILVAKNLNEMYIAAGKNRQYALQSRASANKYADMTKEKFMIDAQLATDYHTKLTNGKWNHLMSQTHIGYTNWNNPPANKMPDISYIHVKPEADMGYVVEHAPVNRFNRTGLMARSFANFDPYNNQTNFIEIFNRGTQAFEFTAKAKQDWIKITTEKGIVTLEEKIYVSIDWAKAPKGRQNGEILLSQGKQEFNIRVPIINEETTVLGFVQNNGVIAIEAANFHKKTDAAGINWTVIPNLGRTHSAITVMPTTAEKQVDLAKAPSLEYQFTTFTDSLLRIEAYLSPTLNFKKNEGLHYAIAIDNESPQIINMNAGEEKPDWEYPEWWNTAVTDHIRKKKSTHVGLKAGVHTLRVWMVDPGIVFQRFVIDSGGLRPSYLGPVESVRK